MGLAVFMGEEIQDLSWPHCCLLVYELMARFLALDHRVSLSVEKFPFRSPQFASEL